MKVSIAEHSGFCFGVERAIKIVEDASDIYKRVVTFGPIIHNPQVVKELQKVGVETVNNLEEITENMTVVIRTHGVEKNDYCKLKDVANLLDATCPFVKKVQDAAAKYSEEGLPVIVVGEKKHPEVRSIVSFIAGEYHIINSVEEASNISCRKSYGVVAQTTQNEDQYQSIINILAEKSQDLRVSHTICSATRNRQMAAIKIANNVDVMIIVGGKNSANTARLYELCQVYCDRTYYIETVEELTDDMLRGASHVGISAGASTPSRRVDQVKEYILERANEQ